MDIDSGGDDGNFFGGDAIVLNQTFFGPGRPGDEARGALVTKLVKPVFEVFQPGGIGFVFVVFTERVVLEGGAIEGNHTGDAFEPVGRENGCDLGVKEQGVQSGVAVHVGEQRAGAPSRAKGPVAFVNGDFSGYPTRFEGWKTPIRLEVWHFGEVGLQALAVGDVAEGLFDDETEVVHKGKEGKGPLLTGFISRTKV